MSKRQRIVLFLSLNASGLMCCARGQPPEREPAWFVRAVEETYALGRQYAYDAVVEFARKTGEQPPQATARFQVNWAAGAAGEYLLRVSNDRGLLQYLIVSDGRKTWGHVPAMNKYMEVEGSWAGLGPDPDQVFSRGAQSREPDSMLAAELVVPVLRRISSRASLIEMNKVAEIQTHGETRQLPLLSVLSEKTEAEGQTFTQVALDPDTIEVFRLEWTKSVAEHEDQKSFAVLKGNFEKIQIGDRVPAALFAFSAPAGAVPVEELPLPGLDGSSLRTMTAPDFELTAADGTRTRLAALHGRPILLAFIGSGGAACASQWAALASLRAEYQNKLAVVVVRMPPASVPPAAGFGILDDASGTVHRLYGIHVAPTLVLVDEAGKIAAFLPGARDAAALRSVFTSAGL